MRCPRPTWTLALCVTASLLAIPSYTSAQRVRDDQRESPEVRKLSFEGVKNVDVRDLSKSLSTRASKCRNLVILPFCLISHSPTFEDKYYLNEREVQRDVLRIRVYYWKRGFRDTQVDTTIARTGKQAAVTFKVTEGRATLVRRIAIAYDSTLLNDKVRTRLTLLHANDRLDLILLDSMRVLFQNELWDLGFGDAVVDTTVTVNEPAYLADVGLSLTPNRRTTVGKITIAGTQKVDQATVLNALAFQTGDLYRQSSMLESQRNLYESNLFRLATIFVPLQRDSVKNINIDVTEAPLHEARLGPGLNNIDFFQFQSHYTAYNFFGGARRLDIDGTVGNLLASSLQGRGFFRNIAADVPTNESVSPFLQPTYNASVDFNQPSFLRRPSNAAGFGGFAHRNINPGVYIDRGYGGQATLTHQVRPRAPLSINYRYELNRVQASDPYFCVNYGVCDTLTIGALRSRQSLSPATLTGFIDRSDLPFSPTKGYVARFTAEHASSLTQSDYRYNRIFFDAAIYGHKSQTAKVYSAHLRFGLVKPMAGGPEGGVMHPRKRFYAGGANSVRGYAENQLGPRILTIDDSSLVEGAASLPGGTCGFGPEAIQFCDPNTSALGNDKFLPQPLGGNSILEASVEYRFPLNFGPNLRHFVGAVFIDGGVVGRGNVEGLQTISNIVKGTGAITPGFGMRYESPVGPIRIDFAINPNRAENLGVVTTVRDATGRIKIVPLSVARHYVQGRTFLDRLSLHFSIGEAY